MDYMDVKAAADKWNLTERRITALCRNGRIKGTKKEGGLWLIPIRAEKPTDGRKNKFSHIVNSTVKLPLPIGVSDFKDLAAGYYYADKTMILRDLIDSRPKVTLFTRPRRFGKTLTMDMLKTFFEIGNANSAKFFRDKKIWNCGEKYRSEQGKYPVIFVTFKDIKYPAWDQSLEAVRNVIAAEYRRHICLLESDKCDEYDKKYIRSVIEGNVTEVGLAGAFRNLSDMLKKHYGQAAVIIIDEYDTPIIQGSKGGYYEQITGFMRNLLCGAFKDNSSLSYGFLTGIRCVAKESVFSGLNNLTVHSVTDEKYGEYFGFTASDVKEMAEYYAASDRYGEICKWYDGYKFGKENIFNPWSVINYFYNNCSARAYWQSTEDNSIIRKIVAKADSETADDLCRLMQGKTVSSYVNVSADCPEIKSNRTALYNFLLSTGYLRAAKKDDLCDGSTVYDIAIPNKEILCIYEREILSAFSNDISQSVSIAVQQAAANRDVPALQENLQNLLLNAIGAFGYSEENIRHRLILGICAVMNGMYCVQFESKPCDGRYTIRLMPDDVKMPGVLIELTELKGDIADTDLDAELEKAAEKAVGRIEALQSLAAMEMKGVAHFIKIGMSFYKNQVRLMSSNY